MTKYKNEAQLYLEMYPNLKKEWINQCVICQREGYKISLPENIHPGIEDDRYDYGEERFITFGILEGRVVVVVHTENGDSIRIISIRRATRYEEKTYFSQIPD